MVQGCAPSGALQVSGWKAHPFPFLSLFRGRACRDQQASRWQCGPESSQTTSASLANLVVSLLLLCYVCRKGDQAAIPVRPGFFPLCMNSLPTSRIVPPSHLLVAVNGSVFPCPPTHPLLYEIGAQDESQLCKVITEPPVLTAIHVVVQDTLATCTLLYFFLLLDSQYYKFCFEFCNFSILDKIRFVLCCVE